MFTKEELIKINKKLDSIPIIGARYPKSQDKLIDK